MLHVEDARAGREFLRRLTPHVDSAAEWWQAGEPWIAVAITYAGLVALGVPEDSLQSFPEAFRVGMAARADKLLDARRQRPEALGAAVRERAHPHRVSASSATRRTTWRRTMDSARRHYEGRPGLTVLTTQDFGAQPGDLNPLGYKDSIGQPAIEGSGVEPLPGQGPADQGRRVHPRLPRGGRRAASGAAAGRAGTKRHLRRAAQVPVAGRDVQPLPAGARSTRSTSGSCSRRSWWGAGAAARH